MITLYVMKHNKTGLKYFGKSEVHNTVSELMNYRGSGLYWRRHLKKHGPDISVEILYSSNNTKLVSSVALMYSKFWNIVESKEYANLKLENGLDGAVKGSRHSDETKLKLSSAAKNRVGMKYSDETCKKISKSHLGRKKTQKHIDKKYITSKEIGRYFNIYDKFDNLIHSQIWRKDLLSINQSLISSSYSKRLGDTKFSRIHLNRTNKLHMIGWYAIEIDKE